eukprot:gene24773-30174_t
MEPELESRTLTALCKLLELRGGTQFAASLTADLYKIDERFKTPLAKGLKAFCSRHGDEVRFIPEGSGKLQLVGDGPILKFMHSSAWEMRPLWPFELIEGGPVPQIMHCLQERATLPIPLSDLLARLAEGSGEQSPARVCARDLHPDALKAYLLHFNVLINVAICPEMLHLEVSLRPTATAPPALVQGSSGCPVSEPGNPRDSVATAVLSEMSEHESTPGAEAAGVAPQLQDAAGACVPEPGRLAPLSLGDSSASSLGAWADEDEHPSPPPLAAWADEDEDEDPLPSPPGIDLSDHAREEAQVVRVAANLLRAATGHLMMCTQFCEKMYSLSPIAARKCMREGVRAFCSRHPETFEHLPGITPRLRLRPVGGSGRQTPVPGAPRRYLEGPPQEQPGRKGTDASGADAGSSRARALGDHLFGTRTVEPSRGALGERVQSRSSAAEAGAAPATVRTLETDLEALAASTLCRIVELQGGSVHASTGISTLYDKDQRFRDFLGGGLKRFCARHMDVLMFLQDEGAGHITLVGDGPVLARMRKQEWRRHPTWPRELLEGGGIPLVRRAVAEVGAAGPVPVADLASWLNKTAPPSRSGNGINATALQEYLGSFPAEFRVAECPQMLHTEA